MKVRRVDFSPDEWLGGTIGLNNADRGLYITACAMIYSAGKPIEIADLFAACVDHGNALKTQLNHLIERGKLLRNGDEIDQKRARKELQKAQKRSRKARQNGLKGGRPPNNINDLPKPGGLLNRKPPVRDHQPSTINHQEDADASSVEAAPPPLSEPDQKPPPPERRNGRKARLSADWQPDLTDCEYALSRGWRRQRIAEQIEAFRDHHSAKATTCADWHAAWRTWVRRSDEFATRNGGSGGSYGGRSPAQPGPITAAMRAVLDRGNLG